MYKATSHLKIRHVQRQFIYKYMSQTLQVQRKALQTALTMSLVTSFKSLDGWRHLSPKHLQGIITVSSLR